MTLKLLEPKIRRTHLFAGDNEQVAEIRPFCLASTGVTTTRYQSPSLGTKTYRPRLLLVSNDTGLGASLNHTAFLTDLAFQQVADSANAGSENEQDAPAAVLVDLDLPALEGWKTAERFLTEDEGPPLILLTGRVRHFDMEMALRAGMVLNKLTHPAELAEQVSEALTETEAEKEHRRAGQRLLMRLLRPYDWTALAAPANRDWGINE